MKYKQKMLFESNWGGRRHGAGRKGKGVRHAKRDVVKGRWPMHVVWRVVERLRSLRKKEVMTVVIRALTAVNEKGEDFRVVEFSIQSNHIHMIVEAEDRRALARGMQGLGVRLARGINKFFGRVGKVFQGRFFSRVLKTPKETRRAIVYVLQNFKKHGRLFSKAIDALSSGAWFKGWKEVVSGFFGVDLGEGPVVEGQSWLLREGWKRHGLIAALERPR